MWRVGGVRGDVRGGAQGGMRGGAQGGVHGGVPSLRVVWRGVTKERLR